MNLTVLSFQDQGLTVDQIEEKLKEYRSDLHQIDILDLQKNRLESIPDLTGFTHLQYVNVAENRLTKVDFLTTNLFSSLQSLYLNGNDLETIPRLLLPSLLELDLNTNRLTQMPDFSGMLNLKYVNLSCNRLTKINLPLLHNLENLSLGQNRIIKMGDLNLPSLKTLNLRKNFLSTVPNFTSLPNLHCLSLDQNRLTEVPDFRFLQGLKTLFLQGNPLQEVPTFHLPRLEVVSVSEGEMFDTDLFLP